MVFMLSINIFLARVWDWFWATNTILNWPLSKLIELRGNYIWVDGVQLSLNTYHIPTIKKFNLARTYELPERTLAKLHINPEIPLLELGAFIGGVACITNKLLKHPSLHVVVEVNPAILGVLKYNKELNDAQFTILHGAIGYDTKEFFISDYGMSTTISSESDSTSTRVQALTLENILQKTKYEYVSLICDIEGSEISLVKNEAHILAQFVATIIMETHPGITEQISINDMLKNLYSKGFSIIDKIENVYVLSNNKL